MHLKPTAGCQISILIIEKILWRGDSAGCHISTLIFGFGGDPTATFKSKVLPGPCPDFSALVN
jgi:hypothetical protein